MKQSGQIALAFSCGITMRVCDKNIMKEEYRVDNSVGRPDGGDQ
jgi:hypothetical protein